MSNFSLLLIAVAAALLNAQPATADINGNPHRGSDLYELHGCIGCHGAVGLASKSEVPHLAGQQRTYLYNQMDSFRFQRPQGRLGYKISERYHGTMEPVAARLSNQDISDVATYLNSLACSPGQGRPDAPRPKVAAKCDLCHGTDGNSPFVSVPIITGQHEGYIFRQLAAFRDAAQHFDDKNARAHRVVLAAKMDLSDAQIDAAANYYSRLSCR